MTTLSKNKLAIKNAVDEIFFDFINNLSILLLIFLYDSETAVHFIYCEAITVSEESEEGKIFIQTHFEEDELNFLDKEPTIKYFEEIQDYFQFILEQITDLDTRHKVQIEVIDSLMLGFEIGIYQDEDEKGEEESFEEEENYDNFLDEENEEDIADDTSKEEEKDPAILSETDKFFELHYIMNEFLLARKDKELQKALAASSMTGITNVKSFHKVNTFNSYIYRIAELTQKSLPELFDNDCRGFLEYQRKINTDEAINKVITDVLEHEGEKELAHKIAKVLNKKIEEQIIAREFVLEELKVLSYGNDKAQNFVKQSGFAENEYKDTIPYSSREHKKIIIDLQNYFRIFTSKINNANTLFNLIILIVDYIMKYWKLGKYEKSGCSLPYETDDVPF